MWAPANYPNQIRPLPLSAPGLPRIDNREIPCGVASCAPLVQHELLKAVRERMPSVYNRRAGDRIDRLAHAGVDRAQGRDHQFRAGHPSGAR